jgi:hypothetical protein
VQPIRTLRRFRRNPLFPSSRYGYKSAVSVSESLLKLTVCQPSIGMLSPCWGLMNSNSEEKVVQVIGKGEK